jgi:hypothetical protein
MVTNFTNIKIPIISNSEIKIFSILTQIIIFLQAMGL